MEIAMDRRRVVVEGITPEVDDGRFPIKRVIGETVRVEADVFTDGHEAVSCALCYRREGVTAWSEVPMSELGNDRWRAEFTVTDQGCYQYTVQGWLDHFKHWALALTKRLEAAQDVAIDLRIGAEYVQAAAGRARGEDTALLQRYAAQLDAGQRGAVQAALSPELGALMYRYTDRSLGTTYDRDLWVVVDRVRARFGAWYEFFPRSLWKAEGTHGTFKECEERLPHIAGMGFDVVYLPPIHPIGLAHRKGKNNSTVSLAGDVGSPWAIGGAEGGHKAILPELGTLDDFRSLVAKTQSLGMEIALDIAFQVSPDHPYVREHPTWFKSRPDGTIQYAENPPKKYEDIYPFDFQTPDSEGMWTELKSVIDFWIEQGVKIFRIDNPHTKSLRFWGWLIASVKAAHPDVLFLAEAFTRPKVMHYLAKAGFTQSYTYFAWRNSRWELTEYFTELTQTGVREFFRPNVWPNTPDILTETLQHGGRPAFMSRIVLAATLAAAYGIYGPAYELGVNQPTAPGKEEYLNSEKYEIKHWDLQHPMSLAPLITRLNRIRHEHPALQTNEGLRFVDAANEALVAYYKATPARDDVILTVVNLDPYNSQSGLVTLPLEDLGLAPDRPYLMHDLLTDARYIWSGRQNFIELRPQELPAHVFRVRTQGFE